jgi:Zn finger protein HypA/HybF involved in hydrogenase expression
MQYETTSSRYGTKPRDIDYTQLREVATTPRLREMLLRVERENVAQVRDIWLEHFLSQIRCPVCGKVLQHSEHNIFCEDHHFSKEF